MKRTYLLSFLTLFLLAGCSTTNVNMPPAETGDESATTETAELPDVIKIGFVGPLTGNAASIGQDLKLGIETYFSENPTIDGKSVEVIYEDGKCNGADAANAAQKLINVDNVQFILGGQCSGEALAAAPIAEQNKVLLLSSVSSSPEVSSAGDYIFRNYISDSTVAKTMAEFVSARNQKFALLSEQTDYAQAYRESLKKYFADIGKSDPLVLDEVFPVDNADFRTVLTKAKDSEADAVLLLPQSPVTGGFAVRQAKELGLEATVYSNETILGPDFFETAKDAAEGVYSISVAEDKSRAGYAELTEKVKDKVQFGELFISFGYDAAHILADAIAEVGYDAMAAKDHLYSMGLFKGVASDVNFDENGDNDIPAGIQMVQNGEFVLVTE